MIIKNSSLDTFFEYLKTKAKNNGVLMSKTDLELIGKNYFKSNNSNAFAIAVDSTFKPITLNASKDWVNMKNVLSSFQLFADIVWNLSLRKDFAASIKFIIFEKYPSTISISIQTPFKVLLYDKNKTALKLQTSQKHLIIGDSILSANYMLEYKNNKLMPLTTDDKIGFIPGFVDDEIIKCNPRLDIIKQYPERYPMAIKISDILSTMSDHHLFTRLFKSAKNAPIDFNRDSFGIWYIILKIHRLVSIIQLEAIINFCRKNPDHLSKLLRAMKQSRKNEKSLARLAIRYIFSWTKYKTTSYNLSTTVINTIMLYQEALGQPLDIINTMTMFDDQWNDYIINMERDAVTKLNNRRSKKSNILPDRFKPLIKLFKNVKNIDVVLSSRLSEIFPDIRHEMYQDSAHLLVYTSSGVYVVAIKTRKKQKKNEYTYYVINKQYSHHINIIDRTNDNLPSLTDSISKIKSIINSVTSRI